MRKGYRPSFRGIMGHEFVGEVVESPDEKLKGRRVVGELNAPAVNASTAGPAGPHTVPTAGFWVWTIKMVVLQNI